MTENHLSASSREVLDQNLSTLQNAYDEETIDPNWEGLTSSQVRDVIHHISTTEDRSTGELINPLDQPLTAQAVAKVLNITGVSGAQFSEALNMFRNSDAVIQEEANYRREISDAIGLNSKEAHLKLSGSEKMFDATIKSRSYSLLRNLELTAKILKEYPHKAKLITNENGTLHSLFSSETNYKTKQWNHQTSRIKEIQLKTDLVQNWRLEIKDVLVAPLVAMGKVIDRFLLLTEGDAVFGPLTFASPYFKVERSPAFQEIVEAARKADLQVKAAFNRNSTIEGDSRYYTLKISFVHNAAIALDAHS